MFFGCRGLEEKKQAMAKAEGERRRKALEERRKQQQEATNRFRSAIYNNQTRFRTRNRPADVAPLESKCDCEVVTHYPFSF